MALQPTPTHVLLNSGIWGAVSEQDMVLLIQKGNELSDKLNTVFVWKTTQTVGDPNVVENVEKFKEWARAENEKLQKQAARDLGLLRAFSRNGSWIGWGVGSMTSWDWFLFYTKYSYVVSEKEDVQQDDHMCGGDVAV